MLQTPNRDENSAAEAAPRAVQRQSGFKRQVAMRTLLLPLLSRYLIRAFIITCARTSPTRKSIPCRKKLCNSRASFPCSIPNVERLCSSLLPHRLSQIKASENSIRDWLIPLNLDTSHGYAKEPVENSELTKREASTGRA